MYAKTFGLFKNVCWQSTSAQETAEIKKRISSTAIIVEVSNLPNTANEIKSIEKKRGELKLCFISRISEKKNLNFAIDVLKLITEAEIVFDVYGPIEDKLYWNTCQENTKTLTLNIKFQYKGFLKPTDIGKIISQYHALFLPTQNENYGHIIVEALQHARPVILSDQTPWRNLQHENVGFDIALSDKTKFILAINILVNLSQSEFDEMSKTCISYINHQLNIEKIKTQYLELFKS
jgi:glycosyltransferase involved in cell wall biosynthesis